MNTTMTNREALTNTVMYNVHHTSQVTLDTFSNNVKAFNEYKALMDTLRRESYALSADAYNGNNANLDAIFATLGKVFKLVGELPNGAKLRCDSDSAITMLGFSVGSKTVYSQAIKDLRSSLALEKSLLKERTQDDGITPLNGMEKSVANIKAEIERLKLAIDTELEVDDARTKGRVMVSDKTFRKLVEDYIGRKAEGLSMKTREEVETEERARKDARNKKTNERKARKEAIAKLDK